MTVGRLEAFTQVNPVKGELVRGLPAFLCHIHSPQVSRRMVQLALASVVRDDSWEIGSLHPGQPCQGRAGQGVAYLSLPYTFTSGQQENGAAGFGLSCQR